ncbi:YibE/F family protein [Mogibacterium pumilum]|uniref:YibE/F family protein n=1 Tax=Mogibacterium pumilum TaxID=86332 RepID=A0A223ASM3_9FIRM|nr:YibE/F family protein [Mogibacterium pumilum]ASS37966.1 hypothetical protein AXF17_05685 [Mogibacterium pumilum]
MIKILIILFVLLSLLAGGDRTAKSLMTTAINVSIFAMLIELIYQGFSITITTTISALLITAVTIFYQNENNIKTVCAFISVVIVLLLSALLISFVVTHAHLQGFGTIGDVKIQPSNGYEENIGINMLLVQVAVFIVILIGGLIDTAMAVCSGIYEVIRHNPRLSRTEIVESGMNIGSKILSSNINTLFFIFAGEFMIMCINFLKFYSWSTLINSKDFTQEFIAIMISAIGTVIIIPISAIIASRLMIRDHTSL